MNCLVVILLTSAAFVVAEIDLGERNSVSECKRVAEFCEVHEDCCSLSCHSFLRRCVSDTQHPDPSTERPPSTLSNRVETTNDACVKNGGPCDRDEECCSKACLFYAHKCVSALEAPSEPKLHCIRSGYPCDRDEVCCSSSCHPSARRCVESLPRAPQVIAV